MKKGHKMRLSLIDVLAQLRHVNSRPKKNQCLKIRRQVVMKIIGISAWQRSTSTSKDRRRSILHLEIQSRLMMDLMISLSIPGALMAFILNRLTGC